MLSEDGKLVWATQYRIWRSVKHIWQADNDNVVDTSTNPSPASLMRSNLAIRDDSIAEQCTHQAAPDCLIRFQGQWEDTKSEFYYNHHRYYGPLLGNIYRPA